MVLLQTTPKPLTLPALREQRSLQRGINLRNNFAQLSPTAFTARRNYLIAGYKDGAFLKDPDARGKPAANPMTDPAAMEGMMGMMKGNMMMMVPQTIIMGWINAFFSGYVISMSSPHFPLTHLMPPWFPSYDLCISPCSTALCVLTKLIPPQFAFLPSNLDVLMPRSKREAEKPILT